MGAAIDLPCGHPKEALHVSFHAYKNCHLDQSREGLPLSLVSPCPLCTGPVSDSKPRELPRFRINTVAVTKTTPGSTAKDNSDFQNMRCMKKLSLLPAESNETEQLLSSTTLCSKHCWGISSAYLTSVNRVLIILQILEIMSLLWFRKL